MARLHARYDSLDISAHQGQRRRSIDIGQPHLCRLAVEHRDKPSTHHCNEPERLVLVLACRYLYGPLENDIA
jgi:hypothetical protein